MSALVPIKPSWVIYSQEFNGPVTICEYGGIKWLCFQDGQKRWHKEREATSEMLQAFESGDSIEQALRWGDLHTNYG